MSELMFYHDAEFHARFPEKAHELEHLKSQNDNLVKIVQGYHAYGLPPMILNKDQSVSAVLMISETLRARVAELEAALRPFAEETFIDSRDAYDAARKALGLEP